MAEIIREGAPAEFVKGATVRWYERSSELTPAEYPTGTIAFAQANHKAAGVVTDNGDGRYLVTIAAATSAQFQVGPYYWQLRVTDGTLVHNLRSGVINALEDLAAITGGFDGRSSAARIYDTVTAVMEGKASHDQASMAIAGKQLSRYSWEELLAMRGQFAHRLSDAERIARGYMPNKPRTVRFTR